MPQLVVFARDWCVKRKKHGLLAAHQNMLREVMLLGLISFLLVAFEDKLEAICGTCPRVCSTCVSMDVQVSDPELQRQNLRRLAFQLF